MFMSQETIKIYTERMRRKVYKNEASIQVTFVRFRKMLSFYLRIYESHKNFMYM